MTILPPEAEALEVAAIKYAAPIAQPVLRDMKTMSRSMFMTYLHDAFLAGTAWQAQQPPAKPITPEQVQETLKERAPKADALNRELKSSFELSAESASLNLGASPRLPGAQGDPGAKTPQAVCECHSDPICSKGDDWEAEAVRLAEQMKRATNAADGFTDLVRIAKVALQSAAQDAYGRGHGDGYVKGRYDRAEIDAALLSSAEDAPSVRALVDAAKHVVWAWRKGYGRSGEAELERAIAAMSPSCRPTRDDARVAALVKAASRFREWAHLCLPNCQWCELSNALAALSAFDASAALDGKNGGDRG